MASNNTLLRTTTVTQHFLKNAPLTGIGGDPTEPAFSIGDWVRGFMLAPPFAWRWNRGITTINVTANIQDYVKAISNFGWLEQATCNDNLNTNSSITSMEIRLNPFEDGAPSRPRYIAARLDDDVGNITFRVFPIPDTTYTINLSYQLAAPLFQTIGDTWTPIPDYLSHIYSLGFRAKAYEYWDDPRFTFDFQMFLRQLLASSEGLTDTQKNIFLEEFLISSRQQQGLMSNQLSRQGRGGQ